MDELETAGPAKNQTGLKKVRLADPQILLGRDGGRGDIIAAIAQFCPGGRGVEIGTFNGTFADRILDEAGAGELICVDPYQSYDGFNDAINNMDLDAIFAQAQRFLARFGDRVKFLRTFSQDAALQIADESLDFVYIDGNHQSKFVEIDLNVWWPKLKSGGLMMGDDVADISDVDRNVDGDIVVVHTRSSDGSPELYGHYGVYNALRKFSAHQEVQFIITGHQFILPRP